MVEMRYIRKFKIRNRIAIVLLLGLFLFSIVIFQVSKSVSQNVIHNYLYDYISLSQKEMMVGIELLIDAVNMFAVRMLVNQDIYSLFNNEQLSYHEKEEKLVYILDEFLIYKNTIGAIVIATEDGKLYSYSTDGVIIQEPDDIYIKQLESSQTSVWGPILKDMEGNSYILLGRKYRNFYTGQNLGYLILYIRETALLDIYADIVGKWGHSFILMENGYIVSHPDKDKVGKIVIDDDIYHSTQDFDYKITVYEGEPTILAIYSLGERLERIGLNWKIVSIISEKRLFQVIDNIKMYVFLMEIAITIIVILVSTRIAYTITKPIVSLRDHVNKLGNGKTDVVLSTNAKDEIWELENSFNKMVVRIQDLIERNNQEKEKQKEMELIALQAQINPHFIYNTLDAIGWMAKLKKETEIERMVMALSTFFRTSLHKGEQYIMVKEEIELVESYVTIEKMRFPEKFDIIYNISDEIRDCLMLKIILQPLVENAIKHGISEKEGKGLITINGYAEDEDLVFEVIDDGVGFDVCTKEFQAAYNHIKRSGYGLRNVDERIKLEYGDDYGLKFESEKGKGTRVYVRLKIK